jgi:hypothetical protein
MAQPCRIRVPKRLVDIKPDIPRAPRIVIADVEQVRTERELKSDADLIELIILPKRQTLLDRREEAFGPMVPNTAETPAFSGPSKRNKFAWSTDRNKEIVHLGGR